MRGNRLPIWLWGLILLFPAVLVCPSRLLAAPVFHNALQAPVVEVYGAAPGHTPWVIAGPVADGQKAAVDDARLNACGRLIVKLNDTSALQFFTFSYLAGSEMLTLEPYRVKGGTVNDFPRLAVREQGQGFAVPAGLPFHLLHGDMEADMLTQPRWEEWMNPLGLKNFRPERYAVSLGGVSWSIVPGTAEFAESAKGGQRLRAIRLSAPVKGQTVELVLDSLQSGGALPLLLEVKPTVAIAFNSEGLALETTASLLKDMEQANRNEQWEAFRQQLLALNKPEVLENASGLRMVLASGSLRCELLLAAGQSEAELRMERR